MQVTRVDYQPNSKPGTVKPTSETPRTPLGHTGRASASCARFRPRDFQDTVVVNAAGETRIANIGTHDSVTVVNLSHIGAALNTQLPTLLAGVR